MDAESIRARVADACRAGRPLRIVGGLSKSFMGRSSVGEALDVSAHAGFVEHDPSELVVTVRGGTLVTEVNRRLAGHGQMLAFEPPRFGASSTVGGMVAAGLSGPRRPWAGSVRDSLLGVTCVTGRGERLRFGGRVMKNVAGYDVSRLMAGAMGTLGVILEASFKLWPLPRAERTRVFEMNQHEALGFAASLGRAPTPVSGCCHHSGRLYVRLSGTEPGVEAGLDAIGGDDLDDDEEFWASIRDQRHAFFNTFDEPLWRVSLPPATPVLDARGETLVDWGGAQRWYRRVADPEALRRLANRVGGSVCLFRHGDRDAEVNEPLAPVLFRIHKNLKEAFDPRGILNRGRLYKDL